MPGDLLEGDVRYGQISIHWRQGIPLTQDRTAIGRGIIPIPFTFWEAVVANARQDQWAPFAYIAGLESDYSESVDIIDTNGYHSRGSLQINGVNSKYDNDSMLHYGPNIAAGQDIYDQQGYGAWFNSATILGLPGGAPQQPAPTPAPVTPTPTPTPPPAPGTTVVSVVMNFTGLRIIDVAHDDPGGTVTLIGQPTTNPQP